MKGYIDLFPGEPPVRVYGYDVESISNCFTSVFVNLFDPEDIRTFVMYATTGTKHIQSYYDFIESPDIVCLGFNCLEYDGNLVAYTVECKHAFLERILSERDIYRKSQEYFARQKENNEIRASGGRPRFVPPKKPPFRQFDLQKINNYDGKLRASLKWVMMNMGMDRIQTNPFNHFDEISREDIPRLLGYNTNDSKGTASLGHYTWRAILFRIMLRAKTGVNVYNMGEPKMGVRLLGQYYADKKGVTYSSLKKLRTIVFNIPVKDILIPGIHLLEFKSAYKFFEGLVLKKGDEPSFPIYFKGVHYTFGRGGIHGASSPGVYQENDEYALRYVDASSFYPAIAWINKLYPEHLGELFCEVLEELFFARLEHKELGMTEEADMEKLMMNASIGYSNVEDTILYDPKFFFGVTINGQFILARLIEEVVLKAQAEILFANTDGLMMRVHRKNLEALEKAVEEWKAWSGMYVKIEDFIMIALKNVNSYLSVDANQKITEKNDFLRNKPLHYANTNRIVPLALHAYFLEDADVRKFITEHTELKDFLIGIRCNNPYKICEQRLVGGKVLYDPVGTMARFVVCKTGASYFSKSPAKRTGTAIHKGYLMKLDMDVTGKTVHDYDIDYNFYIHEVNKIIQEIEFQNPDLFHEISFDTYRKNRN